MFIVPGFLQRFSLPQQTAFQCIKQPKPGYFIYSFIQTYYIHQKTGLLYKILKILSRFAIRIYCRKIVINKPEILKVDGPVLIAANHPNSFFDSIILDTLFKKSIWSLARGDVFRNPFHARLLNSLNILPVYRTSEGVENLSENYKTFEACIEKLKSNAIITIYSEGLCVNEWHLRNLKKGTARLAVKAWEEDIPLKVLPVGINYSSFSKFGKNVFLNFGDPITKGEIDFTDGDGLRHQQFNNKLQEELGKLVFEIPMSEKKLKKVKLTVPVPLFRKILFFVPGLLGWLLHAPLYYPLKKFAAVKTKYTGHYDSVITALLLILYLPYLLLLTGAFWIISGCWYSILLIVLMPCSAWAFVQIKKQLD